MKVLLASDGSAAAMNAARFLNQLKFAEKLKLALLTVSMHPELTIHGNIQNPEWEAQEKAFVAGHQAELQELFAGHCDDGLSKLHQIESNAAQAILDVSKRIVADLIVLGAVGHSIVSRMLLGSVSDRVATHATCSVLVVRPPGDDRPSNSPPKKLLVAFDDSAPSRESVNELMGISWGRDTEVSILSVAITESSLFGDELPVVSPNKKEMVELGKAAVRVAKSLASAIPLSSEKVLTSRHAGESIVSFAEENESDLIIIGDSGHGRLDLRTARQKLHDPVWILCADDHQIVICSDHLPNDLNPASSEPYATLCDDALASCLVNQIALDTASFEACFRLLETSRSPSAKSTPTRIDLNRFMLLPPWIYGVVLRLMQRINERSLLVGLGHLPRPPSLCFFDRPACFLHLAIHGRQELHSFDKPMSEFRSP